jgi:hypothetical protein
MIDALYPGDKLRAMRRGTFNRFFIFDSSSESSTTVQNYNAASREITSNAGISAAFAGPTAPDNLSLTSAFAPVTIGVGDAALQQASELTQALNQKLNATGGITGSLAGALGLNSTTIKYIIYAIVGIVVLKMFVLKK